MSSRKHQNDMASYFLASLGALFNSGKNTREKSFSIATFHLFYWKEISLFKKIW